MNLVRFDPFRELEEMSTRLNKFFESKVSADFKEGVLQVRLPKSEAAKPHAVDVKVA